MLVETKCKCCQYIWLQVKCSGFINGITFSHSKSSYCWNIVSVFTKILIRIYELYILIKKKLFHVVNLVEHVQLSLNFILIINMPKNWWLWTVYLQVAWIVRSFRIECLTWPRVNLVACSLMRTKASWNRSFLSATKGVFYHVLGCIFCFGCQMLVKFWKSYSNVNQAFD